MQAGPVYQHDMGGGFEPFRRAVEFVDCVETPIRPLIADLEFIEDKQRWGYTFRYGFFAISRSDFELIAEAMAADTGNRT